MVVPKSFRLVEQISTDRHPRVALNPAVAALSGSVTFRLMREDDIVLLHRWLRRSHVVEWWGGDDAGLTVDETRAKYLPRLLERQGVRPYIAMLQGQPIGWTQSYVAMGAGGGWWVQETDPGVRGIDPFLCDARDLDQGLGTRMVKAFAEMLFADPAVTRIQTDPAPDNLRAIRCYEKAGFRPRGHIATSDGPALLMVQDRSRHAS